MRHPYRTVSLVVVAVVLLTGCSTSHTFRLLLTVKSADTGEPVEGAIPVLHESVDDERKNDMEYGWHHFEPTDATGRVTVEFKVSGYTSSSTSRWYLKIRKDGFEPQVIDINPRVQVKAGEVTPLPVTVELKPLAKKP